MESIEEIENKIEELRAQLNEIRDRKQISEIGEKYNGKYFRTEGQYRESATYYHIDNVTFVGNDFFEAVGCAYELTDSDVYDPLVEQTLYSFRFYDSGEITVSLSDDLTEISEAEFYTALNDFKESLLSKISEFKKDV